MGRHNELGKWGEDLACDMLAGQGYAIAERNWRMGHLELDIVAVREGSVIFAEVKTRADLDCDPLEAVDRRKISNMVNAARAYLNSHDMPHTPQFDLFAVCGTPEEYRIEHIPDAFEPPLKTY